MPVSGVRDPPGSRPADRAFIGNIAASTARETLPVLGDDRVQIVADGRRDDSL